MILWVMYVFLPYAKKGAHLVFPGAYVIGSVRKQPRVHMDARLFSYISAWYHTDMSLSVVFFGITASMLFVLNYLANALSLYWYYLWLDNPMHVLGGIVVAFGIYTLHEYGVLVRDDMLRFAPFMLLSFVVLLGWEVFKLYTGKIIDDDFALDTAQDLLFGMLGTAIGFYIGKRLQIL